MEINQEIEDVIKSAYEVLYLWDSMRIISNRGIEIKKISDVMNNLRRSVSTLQHKRFFMTGGSE